MKQIGETIRWIRKGKSIPQKVLYQGIVSNTFAVQFEKDVYRMNANAFLEILNRLSVSSDEFQRIQNDFARDDFKILYYEIISASNEKNISLLQQYLTKLENYSFIPEQRLVKALTKLIVARLEKLDKDNLKEERKILAQFMSKIEDWTLSDIAFFTNFMPFLPYETVNIQVKVIEKKLLSQGEVQLLCHFYTNMLDRTFQEKDEKNTETIAIRLLEISGNVEFLFFKLLAKLYLKSLAYKQNKTLELLKEITEILHILAKETNLDISSQFERYLAEI